MQQLLNRSYEFLRKYDFPTMLRAINKIEWRQAAVSPYTWLVVLPLMTFLLWTKRIKIIISIASFLAFSLLIGNNLSPAGETLSLHNVLVFLVGAAAVIGLNVYLIFIRQ